MSILQNAFPENSAAGYAGMVADGSTSNRITRILAVASAAFGAGLYEGDTDATCTDTPEFVAAAAAAAGNTGNGTITAAPDAASPVIPGRYTITIVEPGSNVGNFVVEDPRGVVIGEGVVATEFDAAGLTFTIADGATDFAVGDTFYIDVTGGNFIGWAIATTGLGIVPGATADEYREFDNVPILTGGTIFVDAAVAVGKGQPVYLTGAGAITNVATGNTPTGWQFDQTIADAGLVRIARR